MDEIEKIEIANKTNIIVKVSRNVGRKGRKRNVQKQMKCSREFMC